VKQEWWLDMILKFDVIRKAQIRKTSNYESFDWETDHQVICIGLSDNKNRYDVNVVIFRANNYGELVWHQSEAFSKQFGERDAAVDWVNSQLVLLNL
jgi:hypothetical protein